MKTLLICIIIACSAVIPGQPRPDFSWEVIYRNAKGSPTSVVVEYESIDEAIQAVRKETGNAEILSANRRSIVFCQVK